MAPAVLQNNLAQAEYARAIWSIKTEPGVKPEDVLAPAYYAHVAKFLKAGAKIEVTPPDGSWFLELYVRSATDKGANVAILKLYVFDAPAAVAPAASETEFTVKHRGPKGWSVLRNSDKAVVFEDGKLKEDAEKWVTEHSVA